MPVNTLLTTIKTMNDILIKVDFPTKQSTLYLYKGKYKIIGDEILDGVNVIRTSKCSEGYFSYTSIRAGMYEYHYETPTKNFGPKFFGGEWYEIIEGGQLNNKAEDINL